MINLSKLEGFNWDEANLNKNWVKHNVNYQEAEEVFKNKPLKIFHDEQHSQDEDRFAAFGRTNEERLLTVVFTIRNNKIRIISARDRSRKEKKYG